MSQYRIEMERIGRHGPTTLAAEVQPTINLPLVLADRLAEAIFRVIQQRHLLASKHFEIEVGINDDDDGETPGEVGDVRVERYGTGRIIRV